MCVLKPPNFQMQNEDTMGIKKNGVGRMFIMHSNTLFLSLPLSLRVFVCCLALFLVQHVFFETAKFQMENEDIVGIKRIGLDER